MFFLKRDNSNKYFIIKGLITAIFLSAFIYLSYFNIEYRLLNTFLAITGLYLLLTIPKKALFFTGFAIGILWCFWISVSLQYYDLSYLIPILLVFIGIGYGIIFYLFAFYDRITFRLLAIFAFTFFAPFGFNWLKLEVMFIDSYIDTSKQAFALVLISLYLLIKLKRLKIVFLIPLIFAYSNNTGIYIDNPNLNIQMSDMNIQQDLKWKKDYKNTLIQENLSLINQAIKDKKDLVILPETSMPVILNKNEDLLVLLKEKSKKIDIIIGSLYLEDDQIYNTTYHFTNNTFSIAKKVVLVPFGEEIPLPKYFVTIINDIFFNGAKDYAKAKKPSDFEIKGIKFRNAICYEATTDKIFENLNGIKYMIATSNNAWFTPSIEPTLQKLLLRYYAKKYDVTIFHVINGSPNYIVRP